MASLRLRSSLDPLRSSNFIQSLNDPVLTWSIVIYGLVIHQTLRACLLTRGSHSTTDLRIAKKGIH